MMKEKTEGHIVTIDDHHQLGSIYFLQVYLLKLLTSLL